MNRLSIFSLPKHHQIQVAVASLSYNLFRSHGCYSIPATEILHNCVGTPSNRSLSAFKAFCSRTDLLNKKCVPCNSKDLRPMTEQSANELIPKVTGWDLVNENGTLKLRQSWKVKSFTKGLDFLKLVGDVAEAEGHHPDLHLVGWNSVNIEIWTHSVGGLTENDFILAAKISDLDLHHLLRKKLPAV